MALKIPSSVAELATGESDAQRAWLNPLAEQLQEAVRTFVRDVGQPAQDIKDFLNGTWFGHPLHPVLVLLPIGAWSTAAVLDLLGEEGAADAAIGMGVLTSLPTAAAGVAQWQDIGGRPRRMGLMHAMLNSTALGLYVVSLIARRGGVRGLGVALSTVGLGLVGWSGYLGGELSYTLGVGVNRNAWSPERWHPEDTASGEFQIAARADSLRDGQITAGEVTLGGQQIPVVFLKRGDQILALNAICSHLSGPLTEGKLVDGDCVECPWHGSRFAFADGRVVRSPASASQPRFEARVRAGNVEVRPVV